MLIQNSYISDYYMPKFQEEKTQKKIELLKQKEEEESVKILSQKYKIPYADLSAVSVETDALKTLPEDAARRAELIPFQAIGKRLKVAVHSPDKDETRAVLKRLEEEGYIHDLFLVSRQGLEHAWEFYKKIRRGIHIPRDSRW